MEMLGFKVADVCECFLYFAEGKQFYTLYLYLPEYTYEHETTKTPEAKIKMLKRLDQLF